MDLASIFRDIGIEGARWIEENVDEQFKAIRFLSDYVSSDLLPRLVVANSLVSYQLTGKGEDWWWEFARFFARIEVSSITSSFSEFLSNCKTNRRLIPQKIARLRKIEAFLEAFDPIKAYEDMVRFRDELAYHLSTQKDAKTVVFAVKMLGYAMRLYEGFRPYPMEINIPLDVRIRKISKDKFFWAELARKSAVPPLHIDSILWPLLGGNVKPYKRFGKTGSGLIRFLEEKGLIQV